MEAKVFRNKIELYHFIKSVADKFDLKKSLIANENSFVTTDGKHVNSLHFLGFLINLNKEVGTNFDAQSSKQTPAGYVIVTSDKVKVKEEEKEEPEVEIEETEHHSEISDEDKAAIISHAESLYDENAKKESKDSLADFAAEKGVTLAKNQTFEGMVDQLKAELEQK